MILLYSEDSTIKLYLTLRRRTSIPVMSLRNVIEPSGVGTDGKIFQNGHKHGSIMCGL